MKTTLTTKPDPTLKRTKVSIAYTSSDGYRMEFDAKTSPTHKNLRTGEPVPPEDAMLAAVEELSRILALFGFADEARARFDKAATSVATWRAARGLAVPS